MQDWMRKHRRWLMAFILVFIGIPFVFMFGMPGTNRDQETFQDNVIAKVGNVPILESEFRRNLDAAVASMTRPNEGHPTYQDLDKSGTAQRIIEQMVDEALVKLREQDRNFYVDEAVLVEQMKRWDMFKDESGQFNPKAFNEWVGRIARWEDIYSELRSGVARQVFLNTVMAAAQRINPAELEKELEADNTRFRIKYAKIDPTVTPTEEELVEHFEKNTEQYRRPESVVAEFVAVSLLPEIPERAAVVLERARAGEDFAALVAIYSDLKVPGEGDMGWRPESDVVASHLKPLFSLKIGEVSDPVSGPTGYFIYKAEEERINEESGLREVRGRQIVLHTEMDEAIRLQKQEEADAIAAQLRESNDLASVANAVGLTSYRTSRFDNTATSIDHVDPVDLFQFRSIVLQQKEEPWKPFTARNNIYVARVVETSTGEIPELEEVRERVTNDVIAAKKREEAFQEKVQNYAGQIKDRIATLEDINVLFPELGVEVGETQQPFTRKEMLYQQQVFLQTSDVFEAFRDAETNAVAGPLTGFFGDVWFIQLVERIPPSEEDRQGWEEQRKTLRDRMVQTAQYEILADYTKDLRERMLAQVSYQQNTAEIDRILGRNWETGEGEGEDASQTSVATEEATAATEDKEGDTGTSEADKPAAVPNDATNDMPPLETPVTEESK